MLHCLKAAPTATARGLMPYTTVPGSCQYGPGSESHPAASSNAIHTHINARPSESHCEKGQETVPAVCACERRDQRSRSEVDTKPACTGNLELDRKGAFHKCPSQYLHTQLLRSSRCQHSTPPAPLEFLYQARIRLRAFTA